MLVQVMVTGDEERTVSLKLSTWRARVELAKAKRAKMNMVMARKTKAAEACGERAVLFTLHVAKV